MTKVVITSFIFLLSTNVFSACEVYGISDGPQKLDCSFNKEKVALRCVKDNYYLGKTRVKMAYHLEVEEGPTPLVFKTSDSQLTVTIQPKVRSDAELDRDGRLTRGYCY